MGPDRSRAAGQPASGEKPDEDVAGRPTDPPSNNGQQPLEPICGAHSSPVATNPIQFSPIQSNPIQSNRTQTAASLSPGRSASGGGGRCASCLAHFAAKTL